MWENGVVKGKIAAIKEEKRWQIRFILQLQEQDFWRWQIFWKGYGSASWERTGQQIWPRSNSCKNAGIGKVGHVANSCSTVIGESYSAGRIYDKIGDTAVGKVLYKMPRGILCELVKPVDEIKF